MAKHILLAFTNPVPGREADYHAWQEGEHIPYGLKNAGFVRATRYKLAGPQLGEDAGRTQYLTVWEIEADDIDAAIAGSIARNETAVFTDALDLPTIRTALYTAFQTIEREG